MSWIDARCFTIGIHGGALFIQRSVLICNFKSYHCRYCTVCASHFCFTLLLHVKSRLWIWIHKNSSILDNANANVRAINYNYNWLQFWINFGMNLFFFSFFKKLINLIKSQNWEFKWSWFIGDSRQLNQRIRMILIKIETSFKVSC